MSNTNNARATYAVAPERQDGDLLNIGQQCSATEQKCTVVDYLPFVCDHCKKRFCQDHRTPESHSCEKWDESMADRRAMECPLCSELIAIPPGEDPNIRLGRHVDEDCVVMTGNAPKKSSTPTCSRARCGKPLWQPITCDKCRKQFCASHRYPKEHQCSSLSTASSASTPPGAAAPKNTQNPLAHLSSRTSAKGAAAMAALKRQLASTHLGQSSSASSSSSPATASQKVHTQVAPPVSASTSASSSTSNASSKTKMPLNISAKDRRAVAERKSQLRAMEERQRRGLLSPQEEERLRALQESVKDDKDCIIM